MRTVATALRVFLAMVVLLNGTALPSTASAMAAPGGGMHSEHAGHDSSPGTEPEAPPARDFPMDCCDGGACGCGCAMPAAGALPVLAGAGTPHTPCDSIFPDSLHDLGARGAPFRPPA